MPIVFENPPETAGGQARGFGRDRSPERQDLDDMLGQLVQYPDQWGRLYDFAEDRREDADKHANRVRSAASYLRTGKGWSVTVRRTDAGWAVFARMSSEPVKPRAARKPVAEAQGQSEPAEQAREATFQ